MCNPNKDGDSPYRFTYFTQSYSQLKLLTIRIKPANETEFLISMKIESKKRWSHVDDNYVSPLWGNSNKTKGGTASRAAIGCRRVNNPLAEER